MLNTARAGALDAGRSLGDPKAMLNARRVARLQALMLVGLFAAYFVVNLGTTGFAVHAFLQAQLDTALWQSALWQAGQFRNPLVEITYALSGVPTHPFTGLHFMPIGFLYGPIYRFVPGMYTTAFLYAVFFTLTGIVIYLTVRRITGSYLLSLALAAVYLFVFTPVGGKFYSIEDWAACDIAIGLFFFTRRQFRAASLFFLLAAMAKEYFSLAIAAFGFALFVGATFRLWRARHQPASAAAPVPPGRLPLWRGFVAAYAEGAWGIVWAFAGALWFLVAFFIVMPYVEPNWVNEYMFQAVGGSLTGVVDTFRANPLFLAQRLAGPTGVSYLLGLLAPLCLLSVIGIEYAVAIVPIVLINFLPDPRGINTESVGSHYSTWFMPFLVVGAAVGYVRLRRLGLLQPRAARWALAGVVGVVLLVSILAGMRSAGFKLESSFASDYALSAHRQDVEAVLAQIPSSASVASYDFMLAHLAERSALTNVDAAGLNVDVFRPDYLVCDAFDKVAAANTQTAARALGLKLLSTSPDAFYVSAQWQKSAVDPCPHAGYAISYQRGSVILHKRAP